MTCPLCNAQDAHSLMLVYDDRYGYPGTFALSRCGSCSHGYLECTLSPSELAALYTDYYPRKSMEITDIAPCVEQGAFRVWFDGLESAAFRWVPRDVRVLDIGCGFGQSLAYHAARGCDAHGVEADENTRRIAQDLGLKVQFGLFDDTLYEQEYFDYVTMDQVIEHVAAPIATLRGIARILKPGGTVILSTPNSLGWGARLFGRYWINWHAPYHRHFFSRQSMRHAAEQAGLVLLQQKTVTNSAWLFYQWMHLLTRPSHGEPSWFWSPGRPEPGSTQKILAGVLSLIHRTKINHVVTRLLDSVGLGDNFVFVLRKP